MVLTESTVLSYREASDKALDAGQQKAYQVYQENFSGLSFSHAQSEYIISLISGQHQNEQFGKDQDYKTFVRYAKKESVSHEEWIHAIDHYFGIQTSDEADNRAIRTFEDCFSNVTMSSEQKEKLISVIVQNYQSSEESLARKNIIDTLSWITDEEPLGHNQIRDRAKSYAARELEKEFEGIAFSQAARDLLGSYIELSYMYINHTTKGHQDGIRSLAQQKGDDPYTAVEAFVPSYQQKETVLKVAEDKFENFFGMYDMTNEQRDHMIKRIALYERSMMENEYYSQTRNNLMDILYAEK